MNISPNNFNAFLSRHTSFPRAEEPTEASMVQIRRHKITNFFNSPFSDCQASFIKRIKLIHLLTIVFQKHRTWHSYVSGPEEMQHFFSNHVPSYLLCQVKLYIIYI